MSEIILKGIIDEDFVNYRVPSMTLMFPYCTFKCGIEYCQNSDMVKAGCVNVDINELCRRYVGNPITEAVVCQGLEPFDSFIDLYSFVSTLRKDFNCQDTIVIYTGYNKDEIENGIDKLKSFPNIIIKFGRFIPNQEPHYDEVLGVKLASNNQYARKIS